MKKKCSKCHNLLDASCFSPCSGGKYLRPECRKCGYELSKERKKLRDQHGYPDDTYSCPICREGVTELQGTGGKKAKTVWVIDHKHTTKKFRGHLCHNCNRGIGNFKEDIERLWRAIEYLSENDE